MESPLHLKVHGGFGEGNGETRLSKGWKVRPVPTLLGGQGASNGPWLPDQLLKITRSLSLIPYFDLVSSERVAPE
jgi:hypothetical protein